MAWWISAAVQLVLLIAVASVDLVRRDEGFRPGLVLLGACALVPLLPALGLAVRSDWDALRDLTLILAISLWILQSLCCALALALSLSRALRPEGPWRWRPRRLGLALLALVAVTPQVLRVEYHGFGLPILWACSGAVFAFARDGGPRIERGGALVIPLLWVAGAALIGGLEVASMSEAMHVGAEPDFVTPVGAPAALAVVAASLAIWRPPVLRVLLLLLPGGVASVAVIAPYLYKDQPAVTDEPVPELVDLTGAEIRSVLAGERWRPPSCVRRAAEDCEQGSAPWRVSPSTPLSEAPDGPWVVHRARRRLGWKLGYRALAPADRAGNWVYQVELAERDGQAVLLHGPRPFGDGFWAGEAVSLEELHAELQRWERAPWDAVLVQLPRTPRWTTQDGISICASFAQARSGVGCVLGSR